MTSEHWSPGRGYVDSYDPADDWPPAGPTDGCTGQPWCDCHDCGRLPSTSTAITTDPF